MIEVNSPRLLDLVAEDASVDQVCTGFTFTEGPIWHPGEQCLYFSDIPEDKRRRWSAADGASDVRHPNNKGNGMTLDADLNLYICEHVTSVLARETPSGERQVLASHYNGKELNSPNDVVVKSDGSVYFSDPWYGRMPVFGLERDRELGFQAIFRVATNGEVHCEVDDFDQPNGLCFSPDESILYVNDTTRAHIRVFDVGEDGSLSNGRMFAENVGDGRAGEWRGRRHEVRRARQRLRHRPARLLGLRAGRRAPRRDRDAGALGQPQLGRHRVERALLHLLDSVYRIALKVAGNRLAYM